MRTLYVTDMDGTLLDDTSHVSETSARIISELSRDGALITVATARTPATVVPLLRDTLIAPPAIVMTGSALWDMSANRFSHLVTMTPDMARFVVEQCATMGIHPFIYAQQDESHLSVYRSTAPLTEMESAFVEQRQHAAFKHFNFVPDTRQLSLDNVALIFSFGDRLTTTAVAEALRADGRFSVSCYPERAGSQIYLLEVFDQSVSKARAIQMLRHRLDIDRVVVFGDNLNDIPMFQVADVSVAVANALPEVRAAATITIEANTTDAVPRFISTDFHAQI